MAKQLPGPKREVSAGIVRVQLDSEELTRLLKPIFSEVNDLRHRVTQLEEDSLSHFAVIADLEMALSVFKDDGR